MSNLPIDIASTIQSASIKRSPSPHHDLNPSTAASKKTPVSPNITSGGPSPSSPSSSSSSSHHHQQQQQQQQKQQSTTPALSAAAIHPTPRRRTNIPPLPDLRFEQSYLASIRHTTSKWEVAWITTRDQVLIPLVQGVLWTLVVQGWRYWNRGVKLQGAGMGARVRRWWWGVNDWAVPSSSAGRG